MENLVVGLERDRERLVGDRDRSGLRPRQSAEIGRELGLPGAVARQEVGEHRARVREELEAHGLGLLVDHGEIVAQRASDGGGRGERRAAGQLDAAVLRHECRLRELGGVVEVAELRWRKRLLQIARLRQHRAGDGEGELVGVARRLAADFVDLQIERNGALADLQCSRRMQHKAGFGRIELAQHDQQLEVRRQRGLPVRWPSAPRRPGSA